MFDRLLMTRSGLLRTFLVIFALPVVWLAWLGLMVAAGFADMVYGKR